MKVLVAAFLAIWSAMVQAETLFNITALSSLKEVKAIFPNATYTRVKASWVTEDQAFFRMEGTGFPGRLMLTFDDYRPNARKQLAEMPAAAENEDAAIAFRRQFLTTTANQTEDEALELAWIRWIPAEPIPLERYKTKYGPPRCDFQADDMKPFCAWDHIGLRAITTDDQKQVIYVEPTFTKGELRAAYLRKWGYIPDSLKESPRPQDKAPAATTPSKKLPAKTL